MKVLVTGGAGFIGSHIVERLLVQGHQVVVVDNLTTGNETHLSSKVSFYRLNIQDEALMDVFAAEKPDAVIHQAGQSSMPRSMEDPIWDAETNIIGTIRLLEGARRYGVKKMVYASSAAVYGNPQYLPIDESHPTAPLSPYGISKWTPEMYLRNYGELYGLSWTVLRYANVYGTRQVSHGEGAVISIFIDQLLKGEPLTIDGDGEQTRDYIYVEDVARANIAALVHGDGEILNIGTGQSTSINQLIQAFESILGRTVKKVYGASRPGDIRDSYFDNNRAIQMLDWRPSVLLQDGLKRTYEYYRGIHAKNG
ncbi:SDR family oxidoreductase [Kroppenstedtia pulmonis]|uniref:SDR family oxidoreductase n=1 Tax=Kroppenstedtia pulmonis TaxID=1380685 RepID=A0A7D3Y1X0_9BACL|nr:SDR family oxidoreductase [Kroppenstedtia pulmonis]QKG85680.1 SDR family oxidoreductase [Kroppenstedtia pulmonis]